MRKSGLIKAKQDRLIEYFVAGATARCSAATVSTNRKTAIYYFHRLREIIVCDLEQESRWYGLLSPNRHTGSAQAPWDGRFFGNRWRPCGAEGGGKWTVRLCYIYHRSLHDFGNENDWWEQNKIDPIKGAGRLLLKIRNFSQTA